MVRVDEDTLDLFINPINLTSEEDLDAAIDGAAKYLRALKFAKKNDCVVWQNLRQRKGKDWHFIAVRVDGERKLSEQRSRRRSAGWL